MAFITDRADLRIVLSSRNNTIPGANMPHGTKLTAEEKRHILVLHEQSKSQSEIAAVLGLSKTVVQSFISSPEKYGTAKSPVRSRSLTPADKNIVKREASKSLKSARD